MMRRSVRILVLLLTIAVTAGVVWRATMNEQVRGRMRLAAQQSDALATDAIFELIDLRSSLHAYVAPGQGEAFWAGRAQGQMASLHGRLRELEPASTAANHPLTTAMASLDGLAAVEARARASVRDSQSLVAGDIIFTEARDLIDSAARDLSDARQAMARATSAREAGMANEQSLLAGALMAAWIFALILLVPVPRREVAAVVQPVVTTEQGGLSLHLRDMTSSPPPNRERSAAAVAPVAPAAPVAAPAPAPVPPAALVAPVAVLESLASLCADIARVSDVGELGPLLGRTAALVGARGVVVWLAAGGGQELVPAVSHGYDENMLARLGPIAIDDHNLTAAAFRTEEAGITPAQDEQPGAVAVPLLSASGANGVLAAELLAETNPGRSAALAGIIAAQLAALFPASAASGEPPQHAHAN